MLDRKFTICFYPGAMNLGGVGRLTVNLAEVLIKLGHEVHFYLVVNEGNYLSHIPEKVKVFTGKGGALKSVFSFAKYLNINKPDVVISSRDYLNLLNILISKIVRPKTQVISSIHVDYSGMPNPPKESIFFKHILKLLYPISDNIIAVSRGVAKDFSNRFDYPLEKIDIIYNPTYVQEKYIHFENVMYKDFFNTELPIIISVGRLNEQKNFPLLIRAFKRVNKIIDSKLVILGEGELQDELDSLVCKYELEDKVLMPGYVENPIDYIKKSDVFVLSSNYEGFGNVIVEALGTGISVVSTDCPSGPAEILNNIKYGKLVPINDVEQMSDAIIEKIHKPLNEYDAIERARDFSVDKITLEYLELILNFQNNK